jgi:glycosyltransferase involved in cell wall biosynthesis
MVVMHVLPDLKLGGAQTSVVALCAALLDHGAEVVLVSLGPETELASSLPDHPRLTSIVLGRKRVSILFFPGFLWSVVRIVRELARIMARHRVDVVQGHLVNASLLGGLGALAAGVPRRYATFHSVVFLPREGRGDLRNRLLTFALRLASKWFTRYIAVSDAVRTALLESGISRDRIVVVPNGVSLEAFRKAPREKLERLRNELGLNEDARVVVSVGTLREAKGHRYLFQAASKLRDDFPEVVYLIVGDGRCRPRLDRIVSDLDLLSTVRLVGARRDVVSFLSLADIFVLPSLWEGLPLALIEAMAVGIPCIATSVGGNAEVLSDPESGILVEAGNAESLEAGLRELLVDQERARALGENGRAVCRARYSIGAMVARLVEVYGN